MAEQAPRHFWLCADDYGIAPGVNAAIRDLIARGRLNATSVMVVAPSCTRPETDALKNAGKAAIGLHLTLTAPFKPLTAGYGPLENGTFHPVAKTLCLAMLRRLDRAALAREVDAQITRLYASIRPPAGFHRRSPARASLSAGAGRRAGWCAAARARGLGAAMRERSSVKRAAE